MNVSRAVRIVDAMHFTIKEDGIITGACCKVNLDTNEVFDLHNEADFVPDKVDDNVYPGEEFIVFEDRKLADEKLERIPIIVVNELTSEFEHNYYYWRQGQQKAEKVVDVVLSDAKTRCEEINTQEGKLQDFVKE